MGKKDETKKLILGVPADLHEEIRKAAEADDRTAASWVRTVIREALEARHET